MARVSPKSKRRPPPEKDDDDEDEGEMTKEFKKSQKEDEKLHAQVGKLLRKKGGKRG